MYKLNDNYVKVSAYDIYLALGYCEKNNIIDNQLNKLLDDCSSKLASKEYIKLKNDNPIIDYILKMYKDELDLQMIQNSMLWSLINIENIKKAELEFLYKVVIYERLKCGESWSIDKEHDVILKFLENNEDLYQYIIFTQSIDGYISKNGEIVQRRLKKQL